MEHFASAFEGPELQPIVEFQVCIIGIAGRRGLVVGRPTAVREDPGSNLTAAGRVYHDSHCDIQPWAWVVHPYCSAFVDSAFHPPWDGKMSISLWAE